MSFVATAIVGGAVVGAVASDRASDRASDAIREGTDTSVAEQRRQYDTTRADFAPWRAAGGAALDRLGRASTGDLSDFTLSPSYDFVRSEGIRDIENRFSPGGFTGNAMRALVDYNTGLASREYGNWWNRQAGLAGIGFDATGNTAMAGTNAANNISSAYLSQGANLANARMTGAAGINNALQAGLGNYLYARGRGLFDSNSGDIYDWPSPSGKKPYGGPIWAYGG